MTSLLMLLIAADPTPHSKSGCAESVAQLCYLDCQDVNIRSRLLAEFKDALDDETIPAEWSSVRNLYERVSKSHPERDQTALLSWHYATDEESIRNAFQNLQNLIAEGHHDGTKDPSNWDASVAFGLAISPAVSTLIYSTLSTALLVATIPQSARLLINVLKPKIQKSLYEPLLNALSASGFAYLAFERHQIYFLLAAFWFMASSLENIKALLSKSEISRKRELILMSLGAVFWTIANWKITSSGALSYKITAAMFPIMVLSQYLGRLQLMKESTWMKPDLSELFSKGKLSDNSAAFDEHSIEVDRSLKWLLINKLKDQNDALSKRIESFKGKIILHYRQVYFERPDTVTDSPKPRLASFIELEFQ